jgi:predicted RNA-binding protein associated with RNAse of E/G family
MTGRVTVHKLDASGREVWRYTAQVIARGANWVRLEARAQFDREEVAFPGLTLRRGDRMVEMFFADRWYNVFAIYDELAGPLKGWYCNITRPARLEPEDVHAEDLALDLLVYPEGGDLVLDEEEFDALGLSPAEQSTARLALAELRSLAARREGPFADSGNDSAPA